MWSSTTARDSGSAQLHQRGADHRGRRIEAIHGRPGLVGEHDLAFGVDEDRFERGGGQHAKPLLAGPQRFDGAVALRDVPNERNRERAVGEDHACRRDLERKFRPVPADSARKVVLGDCLTESALRNHLEDPRSMRRRDSVQNRRTAELPRAAEAEQAYIGRVSVEHDAVAREPDRHRGLVE